MIDERIDRVNALDFQKGVRIGDMDSPEGIAGMKDIKSRFPGVDKKGWKYMTSKAALKHYDENILILSPGKVSTSVGFIVSGAMMTHAAGK
jgi:hypothetical protein